jgi:hypothetical protein
MEPHNAKQAVNTITSLNNIDPRLYHYVGQGTNNNERKKIGKRCVPSEKFVNSLLQVNKVGTMTAVATNITSLSSLNQGKNIVKSNRLTPPPATKPKCILLNKSSPKSETCRAEVRIQVNPSSPKNKSSLNRISNKESQGSDGKSSMK